MNQDSTPHQDNIVNTTSTNSFDVDSQRLNTGKTYQEI